MWQLFSMFAGASENMNDTDTVSMILSGWREKRSQKGNQKGKAASKSM